MDIRMSNIASPMPQPRAKLTNKLGLPLSGGKVYTYEPGTDIPKKTWRDVDKSVENTNPIQLDAAGEADIYGVGFYRVLVKDFFGLTIYDVEKTGIAVELDASFVVDGDENQHDINNKTIRFFKSMNELLLSKPKKNGQLVTLFAYHDGGQQGGSDLIAIQSGILIENGVTVFRSNVVGFEDYFWVRVNISHITPEMAGAIGDKTYNCRDAFQKCFNVGGDLRLNENSKYLVYGDDITAHRDTYILKCTKPTNKRTFN